MFSPQVSLILAASTGGHLAELVRLAPQFQPGPDSLWITFDTPQSRSLLQGRNTLLIPYVPPRDPYAVLKAAAVVGRELWHDRKSYAHAISTGAAIALAVLPITRSFGIPSTYVESIARLDRPSLTGRILERLPGIGLATQAPAWNSRPRWRRVPGVLGTFSSVRRPETPDSPLRVFVTVGTIKKYPFEALARRLVKIGAVDEHTVWQMPTPQAGLPGHVKALMSMDEFDEEARNADVIICHAGVGTLLRLWELGKYPLVVPRRSVRNEHVDDHQLEIAALVRIHNLGLVREVDDLQVHDLQTIAASGVEAGFAVS